MLFSFASFDTTSHHHHHHQVVICVRVCNEDSLYVFVWWCAASKNRENFKMLFHRNNVNIFQNDMYRKYKLDLFFFHLWNARARASDRTPDLCAFSYNILFVFSVCSIRAFLHLLILFFFFIFLMCCVCVCALFFLFCSFSILFDFVMRSYSLLYAGFQRAHKFNSKTMFL